MRQHSNQVDDEEYTGTSPRTVSTARSSYDPGRLRGLLQQHHLELRQRRDSTRIGLTTRTLHQRSGSFTSRTMTITRSTNTRCPKSLDAATCKRHSCTSGLITRQTSNCGRWRSLSDPIYPVLPPFFLPQQRRRVSVRLRISGNSFTTSLSPQ
jgi:hypothetical protein